ncbi:hypothetical protein MmiEs2_01010 [Methanimicrococcus stummii]|uniref:Uncharacterized protein n=1 Tax=Methanimicrococcus stummii TaxID=3028294 RepID=A0AA96ZYA1_9EURY|nr:hypothetical protein [Methanimicrococcus sp. Es2]WNY27922.1 hypothetical protein MmiEs2_01010 [Methanimicrococcus sp. Es2]
MKNQNIHSTLTYISISLIVLVTSLLLFFLLTEDRTYIDWVGIGFILIAELGVMLFLVLNTIPKQKNTLMFQSGSISIISIYVLAAVFISVIFMIWFRDEIFVLGSVQFALIAIVLMSLLILYKFSADNEKSNNETMQSVEFMKKLIDKTEFMKKTVNTDYEEDLEQISEALRCSDMSLTSEIDGQIEQELDLLQKMLHSQEAEPEQIKKQKESVLNLILLRKQDVSRRNQGQI